MFPTIYVYRFIIENNLMSGIFNFNNFSPVHNAGIGIINLYALVFSFNINSNYYVQNKMR